MNVLEIDTGGRPILCRVRLIGEQLNDGRFADHGLANNDDFDEERLYQFGLCLLSMRLMDKSLDLLCGGRFLFYFKLIFRLSFSHVSQS
jgi:hypothetical protein